MTIQTISVQREFTAETRSTPRKEFYQVKLLTLRPLCLCGESPSCAPLVAALLRCVSAMNIFLNVLVRKVPLERVPGRGIVSTGAEARSGSLQTFVDRYNFGVVVERHNRDLLGEAYRDLC
jgi:hypothetical protein